uniref:Uncharacterized protein n=1 Tax=Myoviridae sp. ct5ra14 TaxID=2827659 RepID=A0A8S5T2K9_9CAUD|nr:MAG TPA: hypothetical protein [Myoviridae sp. ct5ra14]
MRLPISPPGQQRNEILPIRFDFCKHLYRLYL